MNTRSTRRYRRGFTLIELLAVIAMLGAILTLTAMTMQRLMQTEHGAMRDVVVDRALTELAVQFRDDAHRATQAEQLGDGELQLTTASDLIRYAVAGDGVDRRLLDAQGMVRRTEHYGLPGCPITMEHREEGSRRWVILTIGRPGPGFGGSLPKVVGSLRAEIRAVIGGRTVKLPETEEK